MAEATKTFREILIFYGLSNSMPTDCVAIRRARDGVARSMQDGLPLIELKLRLSQGQEAGNIKINAKTKVTSESNFII